MLVVHGGSLVGVSGREADKEGRGWCVERLDEWGPGGNGRWRRVRNVAFKFGNLEVEVKTRVKDRLRNLLLSVLRLKVTSYVSNPPFNTKNLVKASITLCRGRPLPSRIGYRVFITAALPSKLDREENGSTTQGFAKQQNSSMLERLWLSLGYRPAFGQQSWHQSQDRAANLWSLNHR